MIGWLPSVRWGVDRWWLPLSASSAQALGGCLVAYGQGRPVDSRLRFSLAKALREDPALLIYAILHQTGEIVSLDELVDWFAARMTGLFARGDASLAAPTPANHAARVRDVLAYFRTIPMHRWIDESPILLEIAGPQVPASWRDQWPKLVDVEDGGDDWEDAIDDLSTTDLLQQLARLAMRSRRLDESFQSTLRRAKLGALKQLAYGLSHEINNPLANISTRAQSLKRNEPDPDRQLILQRIVDQAYRAHEMIADLMFYANPPEPSLASIDLNVPIGRVLESFQELADRHSIRMKWERSPQPILAEADDVMVAEALRSLIRNAIEAIGCEGTVVVSVASESYRNVIHVADSGPGLSDEARSHAFDPYYSGREAGRGLGLGLCRAYRIARIHHGDIQLAGGPAGCVASLILPKTFAGVDDVV